MMLPLSVIVKSAIVGLTSLWIKRLVLFVSDRLEVYGQFLTPLSGVLVLLRDEADQVNDKGLIIPALGFADFLRSDRKVYHVKSPSLFM